MPKVSVIVPVYNTEEYLPRCIDSILAQTFTDFELILVDDGSTDNSGEICDEYAAKDSRIVVIHKENGGASSARNAGIDAAQGEWISFVDSDDYVKIEYLEGLIYDSLQDENIDFVIQGLLKQIGNKHENLSINECRIYSNSELDKFWENVNVFRHCGSYCKLFRLDLLNKHLIRYKLEIICAEDYEFILRYIFICRKIATSNTSNYIYDSRDGSLSTKIYNFENELSGLKLLDNGYLVIINSLIDSNNIIKQYKKLISYYTHRVIMSIYLYEREDSINKLKLINDKYIDIYRSNFNPETIFLLILKYLFVNKHFWLLDKLLYFRFSK